MGDALRHPPRIHEYQGGPVLCDALGGPVINLAPHFTCRYGTQFILGDFDGQVHLAPMADIDDRSTRRGKVVRNFFDRSYRRREPDALWSEATSGSSKSIQPGERKR